MAKRRRRVPRYQREGKEWEIIGLYPGRPVLNGRDGEHLVLDAEAETVSVVKGGQEVWSSPFENFSGDWAAATFSQDGRFIVLGCPYEFDFRVWERAAEAEPKAEASGGRAFDSSCQIGSQRGRRC